MSYICNYGCGRVVHFDGAACTVCARKLIAAQVGRDARGSKFGNRRVELPLRHAAAAPGERYTFDSQREADRYLELASMERAGAITGLELQPRYPVHVTDRFGKAHHVFDYVADFRYYEVQSESWVVEDAKGYRTAMYRLKKKAVEALYTITIRET